MVLFKKRRQHKQAVRKFIPAAAASQNISVRPYGLSLFRKSLIFLIICAGISISTLIFAKLRHFQIEQVKVVANYEHVKPLELQQIVASFMQKNFFDVDMIGLREKLLQLPWVYSVSVARKWPNMVVVDIAEQQPIAQFKNNALLNQYGQLFFPAKTSFPHNLPILSGPNSEVVKTFHDYQFMQETLAQLGFKITNLIFEAPNSWHLILGNGINLYLSKETYLEQLQNFVKVYSKIVSTKQDGKMVSADLRYSNGMAVKWK